MAFVFSNVQAKPKQSQSKAEAKADAQADAQRFAAGSHGVSKITSALAQSSTLTELNLSYTAMGS